MSKFIYILVFFVFSFVLPVYAFDGPGGPGDSGHSRKPWYLGFSASYQHNRFFGSAIDLESWLNTQNRLAQAQQKNGSSFALALDLQKFVSSKVYFRFGIGYQQRRVDPEENTIILYKDSMKTGYVTAPFIWGIAQPLDAVKTIFFVAEAGPSFNFKVTDHTYSGPDRVDFQTVAANINAVIGAGFAADLSPGMRVALLYHYQRDLTPAYRETLYWGGNPVYMKNVYKYESHVVSLGLQWRL